MNRNRKGVMPEITREMYKEIKKYDRQKFTSFCTDLYKFGYEDGQASVPEVDMDDVIYKVVLICSETKGIGPKKLDEIKQRLNAELRR